MKRTVPPRRLVLRPLLLAGLLLAGATACTESPASPAPSLPDAGPIAPVVVGDGSPARLEFDVLVHDFGKIPETESRSCVFAFTNGGGSTLVIEDVKATCGCTVPTLVKRSFAPGERGEIDVVFEPKGPGPSLKYLNVISNAENDLVPLRVVADVQPFVVIEPRIVELGAIAWQRPHRTHLTVTCNDPEFVIESVRTSNPGVTVTNEGVIDGAEGPHGARVVRLVLEVLPTAEWGNLFSWLEVTVTGRPAADATPITHLSKIRVNGQLFGELVAEPDTFRFGVERNERIDRSIVLTRPSGEPFEVTGATIERTNIVDAQVRLRRAGPTYTIELTGAGSAAAQAMRGTVIVTTDIPGESRIAIPIIGLTREPGHRSLRSR